MISRGINIQAISAVPFAVAVIAGVSLCLFIDLSETMLWIVLLSGLSVALTVLMLPVFRKYSVIGLLLFFICLAWFRADYQLGREKRWDVFTLAAENDSVHVTGRILFCASDSQDNGKVIIDNAVVEGSTRRLELDDMRVRLFADSSILDSLQYGNIVYAVGRMRSGSERTARFTGAMTSILSRCEVCDVYVDSETLFAHKVEGYYLRRSVDQVRQWIVRTCNEQLPPDAASICRALILGDRQDFGYGFQEQLRLTGLSHIFALSGLNTGLIISLLWVALGLLFVPRNTRYLVLLLAALFYMELGREVPSLVRASLMCSVFLLGRLLQRRTHVVNYLAVALILELLWHPMDIVDPGFALSYLSVLGMIAGYSMLKQPVTLLLENRKSGMLKSTTEVFVGTLTAQFGTLPLTAFLFHRIPLIGGLGNLIVVPGFAILLVLASLMLLCEAIAPFLTTFITPSIEWLSFGLGWAVDLFARLPFSGVQISIFTFPFLIAVYFMIFFIPLLWLMQRRKTAIQLCLLLLCMLVWTSVFQGKEKSRLTFIDVGNGDACLIESSGRRFLIDAGPRYGEWSAASIVLPYFADRGIAHLDGLILTHPDSDHIGGAAQLLQRIDTDNVWINGDSSTSRAFVDFQVTARYQQKQLNILQAGDVLHLSDSAALIVLSPDSLSMLRMSESNQKSLAMILRTENSTAFLAGDIDSTIEYELLTWGSKLDVDLLHAGHHGSKRSTSMTFLQATSPSLCVLTAGRRNIYGHPAPEVLERLEQMRIPYLITGRESTLVFESSESGWIRVKPRAQSLSEIWMLPYG